VGLITATHDTSVVDPESSVAGHPLPGPLRQSVEAQGNFFAAQRALAVTRGQSRATSMRLACSRPNKCTLAMAPRKALSLSPSRNQA
jgi:hypothetical protein